MPIETAKRTARPVLNGSRGYLIPHREHSKTLTPWVMLGRYGSPGKIEEVLQKHWTSKGAARSLEDAAADCDWQVKCPFEDEEEISDLQQRFEEEITTTLREAVCNWDLDTPGDFGDILRHGMRGQYFGFAAWAKRWVPDPRANRGVRLEMLPLDWSTFHSLAVDYVTGRITAAKQWLEGNALAPNEIPGDELVWISFGTWPTGDPIVRSLIALVECVQEILLSAMTEAQHDSGFVTIEAARGEFKGTSEKAAAARAKLADHIYEQTGIPAYVLADGKIQVHYAGKGMDKLGFLRYVDDRVNDLLNQTAQSLGATSGSGSRALGDQQGTEDTKRRKRTFNNILRPLGQSLFPWFAECWGYNRDKLSMPTLEVAEAEKYRDPSQSAALLTDAMSAGVLDWPRPLAIHHLREHVGLPEETIAAWEEWADAQSMAAEPVQQTQDPIADLASEVAQATLQERLDAWAVPSLCGCLLAERRPVEIVDYDGASVFAARDFIGRFEEVVSWSANAGQRAALDEQANSDLRQVQERHVDALRAFLEGETPGQDPNGRRADLDRIREQFASQYAAALNRHAASVTEAVRAQGAEERQRQMQGPTPEGQGADPAVLRSVATEAGNRVLEQAADEGAELARATQHEVVSYWRSGGEVAVFEPRRVTPGVINRGVQAVGNAAESMGRVTEAARNAEPDQVLHAIVRSALMDACEVCAGPERDGRRWDLTTQEGVQDFRSSRARLVPDPECKGTEKHCRCTLIPIWGPRLG